MRVIGDDNKVLEETERLNQEAMYAIYDAKDETKIDTEADWLSTDKLEKKLLELQRMDREYYDFIMKMQYGIRSSSSKTLKEEDDIIVVAFEAGPLKKYYKIGLKGQVTEIGWPEMETYLQEEKKGVKLVPLPSNYSKLIQKALSKFENEVKNNKARLESGLGNEQLWLLGILRKLLHKSELKKSYEQIDYLINNFKKKITNVWIKKDLRRLKMDYKNEKISDISLIKELADMIVGNPQEFKEKGSQEIDESSIPRILYSKYVKVT